MNMLRFPWTFLAGLLLIVPAAAPAAAPGLAGNWKLTMLDQGEQPTLWLLQFAPKDGKWTGKILDSGKVDSEHKLPETTLSDLRVTDDQVRFVLKLGGRSLSFEGKLPPDKTGNVRGTMEWLNSQMFPALLEPTRLKTLEDTFALNKEILAKERNDLKFYQAAFALLHDAAAEKAKPEEVRGWADKAFRAAETYGPRWQRYVAMQITRSLLQGGGSPELALNYARRAERLLEPRAPATEKQRVLTTLADALKKAGKADDLKEVEARLDRIDVALKPEKFAGRKGKSERTVLVEEFTGAECRQCVAADLAFDSLGKAYAPAEVVLLQYRLPVQGPDPMANKDSEARLRYYEQEVRGVPTVLLDGAPQEALGGPVDAAPALAQEFRKAIDRLLEKPAGAKLTATAVRKGNKIDITATASEVAKPGDALRLRVALVEEEVRYAGGNQLRIHHHVVRAFPGGAGGLAVKGKSAKQTVSVDLEELRKGLAKYLDDFAKNARQPFPKTERPMQLKNLKVVAFLQNDDTKEVLQAVQADVRSGE
jgi:hypothetical protein